MSYELRTRTQKRHYVSFDDDDDDYERGSRRSKDPDFTRTVRPRRSNSTGGYVKNITENAVQRRPVLPPKRKRTSTHPSAQEASTPCSKPYISVERTIMSWLIDQGMILENEKVYYAADREGGSYYNKESKKGRTSRKGVRCECCNEVMTVWDFETHAGSSLRKPYEHIYVAGINNSLMHYQLEVWQINVEVERRTFNEIVPCNGASDKFDDACLICADGGNLICCDECSSTFHLKCMGLKSIPQGDWNCPSCVCKYCNIIINELDLLPCVQCNKTYHWNCAGDKRELDLNASVQTFACGSRCREVYNKLQGLVGVKHELEGGFCWTLLQRIEPDNLNFKNRHLITECNSKIALAWEVLNECFDSIIDRHTQINVIQSVVYSRGSNFTRINYRRFYTAILERDDDIVSVATIRVHGTELAEMPFIGTREMYRRNGMSRMLLVTLESIFSLLGVGHLVIPSVEELTEMWKGKCGFSPIDDAIRQKIINLDTLMFPSSIRLQKSLLCTPAMDEDVDLGVGIVDMVSANCAKLAGLDLNLEYTEPEVEEATRPAT